MHLALIIPDVRGGGAQKMMINLANEFVAKGHQLDLVLINKTGSYIDLIDSRVNIINLKKSRTLFSILKLAGYLRTKNPDIILSALFHVNLAVILAKGFSFKSNTKVILSERNHLSLRLSEMGIVNRLLLKSGVRFLYPFADRIIAISDGVKNDLRKIIKNKAHIQTIYNPVVTKRFELQAIQEVESIFPEGCGLKLITSGRLVVQKDYPTLLRALSFYRKNYGMAHLVILGEGTLLQELESFTEQLKINENVSFLGFVDNPLAYMKQADIFVISSAWEGFCNVIVEALYVGRKVVSTDCESGPAEILCNGQFGELAKVKDPVDIAKKIHHVVQKYYDPKKQKSRALEFTSEKKSQEFLKVFEEVLVI